MHSGSAAIHCFHSNACKSIIEGARGGPQLLAGTLTSQTRIQEMVTTAGEASW